MLQANSFRSRSGGQALVDQLLIHGADCAYCVPGESYLEVLDALYNVRDRFTLYNARHEAGAANMAEAYGKLTGKPGICLVTRGPGACHASIGVHIAYQDSTPMILLIGQVDRPSMDREAFQEIDYRQMFGGIAKWVAQINDATRVPEYMARAFRIATSGRPGPVVLALPEDMLTDIVEVTDAPPYTSTAPDASLAAIEDVRSLLTTAQRPLMLVGGSGWSDEACRDITRFAEANGVPVACSFRRQDIVDNHSKVYVGDFGTAGPPQLVRRIKEADVLLVVGARLGEMTTKTYTTLCSPAPQQRLIHIHADANEIGRVYSPELGLAIAPESFARAVADCRWVDTHRWQEWLNAARQDYLDDTKAPAYAGELDMAQALINVQEILPEDVIVTLDAGNHTGWGQRFLRYGRPGRQIGSTCGAMGYSVPAAVAASLRFPEKVVLSFVGDGGFMMSGQEIATAVQHGGKPIILLFNNGSYGTIRMHQEREHPERVVGTDLVNPNFVSMAISLGLYAETINQTQDFKPALERAIAANRPALLEIKTDPELISTRTTIDALRHAAHRRRKALG
ncbi:thiamine pyrophosphate-binding protein [Modicisalibacter luteus]|uniref:Thiamine pyrophosphate-binding protein n=1 Tax=Modicisalibacter luteus TaxID=453962 RepID=A0ABV7M4I0_9GAMM|nr:thiamine pyrophosphate-binding protein [Halomonas lutea]GHA87558.1 thiamine pyrophosphate protein [Halomonas lutea]